MLMASKQEFPAITSAPLGVNSSSGGQEVFAQFSPISENGLKIDGVCCQKRESPFEQKARVSGQKRELIETDSLMGLLTQIERISNWISSYVVEAPKDNSLKNTCLLGIL